MSTLFDKFLKIYDFPGIYGEIWAQLSLLGGTRVTTCSFDTIQMNAGDLRHLWILGDIYGGM